MNPDPNSWVHRTDVWDSPGVERFNHAHTMCFSVRDYTSAWETSTDGFEQRFGIFDDGLEFMTINSNVLRCDSSPYEHDLIIYSVDEDWQVIDVLCYKDFGALSNSIVESFTRP